MPSCALSVVRSKEGYAETDLGCHVCVCDERASVTDDGLGLPAAGIYPLMLAIQTNQEFHCAILASSTVQICLSARDPVGNNNAIHYAALVSPQMLETLLEHEAAESFDQFEEQCRQNIVNGSTPDAIRVLLEKSPSLLNGISTNANTCLNAANQKTSLMSLLHLKHKEMDLNAKNKADFTPLHQFVIREDIGDLDGLIRRAVPEM
uniref:Uncharacterized protein n=1 Tax=Globodera rostochiensis TaxID=31243 RepID=A0A914IAW7_GLORO